MFYRAIKILLLSSMFALCAQADPKCHFPKSVTVGDLGHVDTFNDSNRPFEVHALEPVAPANTGRLEIVGAPNDVNFQIYVYGSENFLAIDGAYVPDKRISGRLFRKTPKAPLEFKINIFNLDGTLQVSHNGDDFEVNGDFVRAGVVMANINLTIVHEPSAAQSAPNYRMTGTVQRRPSFEGKYKNSDIKLGLRWDPSPGQFGADLSPEGKIRAAALVLLTGTLEAHLFR